MIITMLTLCITVSAASKSSSTEPIVNTWKFDDDFAIGSSGSSVVKSSGAFKLENSNGTLKDTVTIVNGVESIETVNGKRAFSKSASGIIDITPATDTTTKIVFTAPSSGTYYYELDIRLSTTVSQIVRQYVQCGKFPYNSASGWGHCGVGLTNSSGGSGYTTERSYTKAKTLVLDAGETIVLSAVPQSKDGNVSDETQVTVNKFNVYKINTSAAETDAFTYNESAPSKVNGRYTLKGTIPGESTLDPLEDTAKNPWWNNTGKYLTWHIAADYFWDGDQTKKYAFFAKSQYGGLIDAIPMLYAPSVIIYTAPYTGTYYFNGQFKKGTDCTSTISALNVGSVTSSTAGAVLSLDGVVELTAGQEFWIKFSTDVDAASTEVAINSITMSYLGGLPNVTVKEYLDLGEDGKLWLVLNDVDKLPSGKVYTVGGNNMLWSYRYDAYCYLIKSNSKVQASELDLSIANGSVETIGTGFDVNGNDIVEVNDAQSAYNVYTDKNFTAEKVKLFLSADVAGGANGAPDYTVNVSDSTAIMNACYDVGTSTPQLVSMWTEYSYDRTKTGTSASNTNKSIVYMAKNEDEGLNITLLSDVNRDSLNVVVLSGENENIEHKFYFARPVVIRGTEYIDALIPLDAYGDLALTAGKTTTVFADFKTSSSTPSGDYPYEIALVDENGTVLSSVKVTVHVWNFAMPEERTFMTAASIYNNYGSLTSPVDRYEFLLDYGLSPYKLPYDILDDRADEYMSDPRVTSFQVPHNVSNETLWAYYEKLSSNPEWMKKAFFYPVDEPNTVEKLNELKAECNRIRQYCPGVRITSPYFTDIQIENKDQIEFMDEYIDLHTPKLANWNNSYIYLGGNEYFDTDKFANWSAYLTYGSFADRMKALQNKGETVWAYVCNEPNAGGYLNLTIEDSGLGHRVLLWQYYQRDIQGFLYWSVNAWVAEDRWNGISVNGDNWPGDGILTYPGEDYDLYGQLIPSVRLVAVRDGIEDIELMYMAEELLGKNWVNQRANSVSSSLTSVNVTGDEFAELRIEIASAIEAALNNQ